MNHPAVIQTIEALKNKAPAAVKFAVLDVPDDDDIGPHQEFSFTPDNPEAASLSILVTPAGAFCWSIDQWSRLQTRLHLKKTQTRYDLCALSDGSGGPSFRDPAELEEIYDAVSSGKIELTAGVGFDRLWCVKNSRISLGGKKMFLQGTGFIHTIPLLAGVIGKGGMRCVRYTLWN